MAVQSSWPRPRVRLRLNSSRATPPSHSGMPTSAPSSSARPRSLRPISSGKSGLMSPASTFFGKFVSNWPLPAAVSPTSSRNCVRSRPSLPAKASISLAITMFTIEP